MDVAWNVSGGAGNVVSAAGKRRKEKQSDCGDCEADYETADERHAGRMAAEGVRRLAHASGLLSHSDYMLKMGVFEVCRIFQPIAEKAVEGDVAEPDDGDSGQVRAAGGEGNGEEAEREEEDVGEVVEGRAEAWIRQIAKHEEVRREEECGKERPAEVHMGVDKECCDEQAGLFDAEQKRGTGEHGIPSGLG
jgi:hypothetical protein